uniref:Uncharacterized protein n=1 Tax=Caenorhabditis japonica TaxID=281687 RepID=A0A8R1E7V5_CAEJA
MEGNPFRPSRDADRSLVHLFDMMRRERDRMTFHNRMANPDVAELDRFYEQNAEINRAQQLLEAARLAALEAAVANTVAHENAAAPPEPEERAPNDRLYERYRNVPRAGALARVMQRDRAMRNVARRQVGNENDENMEEEEEEEGMLLVVNNNNNNNNRQNEERREAEAEAEEENPLLQG